MFINIYGPLNTFFSLFSHFSLSLIGFQLISRSFHMAEHVRLSHLCVSLPVCAICIHTQPTHTHTYKHRGARPQRARHANRRRPSRDLPMTGAPTQPHTHAYKLTCSAVVAAAARKVVYAAAPVEAAAAAAFSAGFQCRRRTRIRIWLLCALVEIEIKI